MAPITRKELSKLILFMIADYYSIEEIKKEISKYYLVD
jgi:hypothetical protein